MSSNPLRRFLDQLRREIAADAGGGRSFRLMLAIVMIFFIGSVLAIGRIAWALSHGTVWVNYRGSPLSRGELYTALALSGAVALCSIGIVVSMLKSFRASR